MFYGVSLHPRVWILIQQHCNSTTAHQSSYSYSCSSGVYPTQVTLIVGETTDDCRRLRTACSYSCIYRSKRLPEMYSYVQRDANNILGAYARHAASIDGIPGLLPTRYSSYCCSSTVVLIGTDRRTVVSHPRNLQATTKD